MEIALALLVTSIGLLGMFALFPAGVQMNKTAIDETQAALFAEQVLNGVKAQAATSDWNLVKNNINLPPPTPDVWIQPNSLRVGVTQNSYPPTHPNYCDTLIYKTKGALAGDSNEYIDFGVRYRLEIDKIPNSFRYAVRLMVRPGQYGTTNTYVFYTELYNHGQN